MVATTYALTQSQEVELKISRGWNLVSLAVIEDGTPSCEPLPECKIQTETGWKLNESCSPEMFICNPQKDFETTCSPKDLIVLYGYDPLEQRYVKIKDVAGASTNVGVLGSVREFYKGEGEYQKYLARNAANSGWLYSTKDCSIIKNLTHRGITFTLGAIPPTANFAFPAGWNFFTVLFDMAHKSLDEIAGDCTIEKAYVWNPEEQTWKKIDLMVDLFPETGVGYGFIFKTSNDCLLRTSTPEIPVAPTLPQ